MDLKGKLKPPSVPQVAPRYVKDVVSSDSLPGIVEWQPGLKRKLDLTKQAIQREFSGNVVGVFVMGSITKEPTTTSDLDVVVVYEDGYFQNNFIDIKQKLNLVAGEINRTLPDHELVLWASKKDHYRTLLPDISYLRANLPTSNDRLDAWCGLAKNTLLHYEASSCSTILGDFALNAPKSIMPNEAAELFLLSTRTLAEGLTELASQNSTVKRSGANHIAKAGLRAAYAAMLRKDMQPRNSYFAIWQDSLRLAPVQHQPLITHLYELKMGKRSDLVPAESLLDFLRYCELQIADIPRPQISGQSIGRTGTEVFAFSPESLFTKDAPVGEYRRFLGFQKNFPNSLYFLMSSEEIARRFIAAGISDGDVLDFYFEDLMTVASIASMNPGGIRMIVGRNEKEEVTLELGLELLKGLRPKIEEVARLYLRSEHNEFSRPWLSTETKLARLLIMLQLLGQVPDTSVSASLLEELNRKVGDEEIAAAIEWECFLFSGLYSQPILEYFSELALKLAQAGAIALAQRILESVLFVNKTKDHAARELGVRDKEVLLEFDRKLSRATQYYALTFHRQGDAATAKQEYLHSLELDPNNYSAIDDLTQLLLEHDPGPEMVQLLEGLLKRFTTNESDGRRQVAGRYVAYAIHLKQSGNLSAAEQWYLRSIQADPQYEKSYYNLALLYEKTTDPETAKRYYRKAIELNPDYTKPYANLASLLENEQNYDDAIKILSQAVHRGVADEDVFANLGNNFLFRGEFDSASENYQKALEVNQNHANALNGMGAILLQARDQPDLNSLVLAASYFQKAFTADPTFEGATANYYRALAMIQALPNE
jgi:Tfp pilus assembly protein PilF/predicted nucleotidyltransferase